ncbi:alpha/beta hydrolase fold domain-containing protein [Duganella sp. FT135W]|uniref:Alpha/beta hydrolase fold domain-containing protein n=1 Tax=Duganella flavida TaxID=2692175 RepID=A0A6L8KNT4_9BURK|nr:alpha/beta hydrolase fold domain-containing protein [Duganella flavida]MYM26201.1 alpha/beta hydrolase fold domain-containing protein [Duganella flavida]
MIRPYFLLAIGVPVLLLALAACSPLTALNALSPGGASECIEGVAYGDGPRRKLDIYRPRSQSGTAPVVVFFYGGNWVSGARGDYAFVGRALAARGIVAVIADYRLYPEVSYPEFLRDAARAVAWTAREAPRYGGDPKRLYVMGHSAGAYNAAMVALDPRWLAEQGMSPSALRGWIGLAGPYDFLPIQNPTTKPVFHFPATPADSQPVHHVSAAAPPALLIAARQDKLVDPVRNTGQLAILLRAQQVPVQERYYDAVRHTTLVASIAAPLRWLAPTLDDVADYVLKPPA